MLKKYGKAIVQPRAHCLSIFTVSRWMDNLQNQRGGQQGPLCWVVPCLASPRVGVLSQHPQPHLSFGSLPPSHPWNVGYWERQSHSRESWWQESLRSRRWRSVVSSALSGQPRLGTGQRVAAPEAEVPLTFYFLRPQLSGSPPLCLSSHQSWPQSLRRQWSKMKRQSQPAVSYKKRAMDSGISETNLTLVFQLFQTIKIKAGLRWLRSSESCYIFLIWQG